MCGDKSLQYTPNATMVDLSAGPGLVERKRGYWGLKSFVLTARLSDWVDRYGLLQVVARLRATKKKILL